MDYKKIEKIIEESIYSREEIIKAIHSLDRLAYLNQGNDIKTQKLERCHHLKYPQIYELQHCEKYDIITASNNDMIYNHGH